MVEQQPVRRADADAASSLTLQQPTTIRFVRSVAQPDGSMKEVPLRGGDLSALASYAVSQGSRDERLVGGWLLSVGSEHTRDAYAIDLERWTRWLADRDLSVLDADRHDVFAWRDDLLRTSGLSDATTARRLAAVSSFYRYLLDEGVVSRNPAERVQAPSSAQQRGTSALSRSEVADLLAAARDDGPVSEALVGLLYWCGLRVSEALAARTRDRDTFSGHPVLHVTGKGRKQRPVRLVTRLADLIDYLADAGYDHVIADTSLRPLSRQQAYRRLRTLSMKSIGRHVHPHMLRASCATHLVDAGIDIREVQLLLDHSDPRTTIIYDARRDRVVSHSPISHLEGVDTDEDHEDRA